MGAYLHKSIHGEMENFMTRIFFTIQICSCLLLVSDLTAQKVPIKATKPAPAQQQVLAPLKLKSTQDSVQYALGAYTGMYLLTGGFTTIDLDYFIAGIEDVFNKRKGMMNDSLVNAVISNYQSTAQKQLATGQEQKMFAALKNNVQVVWLPTGIAYTVLKPGNGNKPLNTDSVFIHFKLSSAGGVEFENTYLKQTPVLAVPASLNPALNEVLLLMPLGAAWKVYIPAAKAYGDKGNGKIPPHSALIVEIELLEIKKRGS